MRALLFKDFGAVELADVPKPTLEEPGDALVRVPNADLSLHKIDPSLSDEQALFIGDIFTTAFDCAVEARIEKGDAIAVVGCGPVGLMAVQAARAFEPEVIYAIDTVSQRLEMAQTFGAVPIDAGDCHLPSHLQDHTDGRRVDAVLECVGLVPALLDSIDMVRAGGHVSVIGGHRDPELVLPLNITFVKAVDLKFCGTANIVGRWDDALTMVASRKAEPDAIISHRMNLSDAERGYELFASREALKVVLTP